ncbi:M56 family metallopeptidase [Hymenobacter arizonensis]|uniref:Signal transducer regulating beta-lactamase production, contains metallopeptidase domain n=1 Tax=Hymenobacter arizonensis TaxID=1227077 RepID=A0A1I5XXR8_HYMAR|nr:M56 family metallopeptidase [Hymenobacter arizonensis]SFQ36517.1 Signal transducer regulating beta-lactamase production, contains metallopeptidase domain [Hymenobacter arizonensis]
MAATLLYLLKANVVLLLFTAAYFGLLRRLTFFFLNRFYLLFALVFSAVYPVLPVPALLPAAAVLPTAMVLVEAAPASASAVAAPVAPFLNWEALGLGLYAGGAALLLVRLLVQLVSLWRLRRTARPTVVYGQPIRALTGPVSPFSFWQTIYLNPVQHPAAELDAVLRHEQVHVRQWHTLDVLLAQVAQALAWCNPAAWLLRRALLDNLEYLADHAALQTGLDRRAYQYSLLRLSHGVAGPSLVSSFTFSSLKTRVAMMNAPLSSTGQLARYLVAMPLVLAVALGFSAARAQGAGPVVPAATSPSPTGTRPASPAQPTKPDNAKAATTGTAKMAAERPAASARFVIKERNATPGIVGAPAPVYYVDGKLNNDVMNTINPQDIAYINVLKGEQARELIGKSGAKGAVIITTKQNQDRADVQAFNQKYGVQQPLAAAPEEAKGVPYLAAPALAYITKNHPEARLLSVTEVQPADGGAPQYRAEIAMGRRAHYLLFDAQGQFIPQ